MANLLLVEDDLDMADAFAEVLRAEGHSVRVAKNGKEGLARLAEQAPDLVICDVEMPVLGGPQMVHAMFLERAGRDLVPVLLASGVVDLHRVAERVGTPYFLRKPFTVEELLKKLATALAEKLPPRPGLSTEAE